ncbi:hypothetical protein GGS23DRAFT_595463 [Durotheca rogersii]|uniref:uncharacterized protein n=1 Tax=Durotheca rogersii TaxID=419775 RepID=UPI00221FCECF|nr:uncharacterized protein GGS23DRAFT_595463 [Durotheca rogersii]KAI5864764.1 hypothetical protein GGS23DRAFT_595463 [Durotheca rogersii]
MGAKASKPAQSAIRKFPSRPTANAPPHARPRPPSGRAEPRASSVKDDAIRADGIDPDPNPLTNPAFSQRLKQMGVATPNPTLSNSSTVSSSPSRPDYESTGPSFPSPSQNPTLSALEVRRQLQERAELEFENLRHGREFLDAGTLREILIMQTQGAPAVDIEKRLRLKSGVEDAKIFENYMVQ